MSPLAPPPERRAAADRGAHEGSGPAAAAVAASPVSWSDPNLPWRDGMSTDGESPEEPGWKAVASPKASAMPEKRGSAQAASSSWLQGFGQPSVYHAAFVIFFEFFAWGLLTTPMLTVSTTGPLNMVYMKYKALLKLFFFFNLDVNGF